MSIRNKATEVLAAHAYNGGVDLQSEYGRKKPAATDSSGGTEEGDAQYLEPPEGYDAPEYSSPYVKTSSKPTPAEAHLSGSGPAVSAPVGSAASTYGDDGYGRRPPAAAVYGQHEDDYGRSRLSVGNDGKPNYGGGGEYESEGARFGPDHGRRHETEEQSHLGYGRKPAYGEDYGYGVGGGPPPQNYGAGESLGYGEAVGGVPPPQNYGAGESLGYGEAVGGAPPPQPYPPSMYPPQPHSSRPGYGYDEEQSGVGYGRKPACGEHFGHEESLKYGGGVGAVPPPQRWGPGESLGYGGGVPPPQRWGPGYSLGYVEGVPPPQHYAHEESLRYGEGVPPPQHYSHEESLRYGEGVPPPQRYSHEESLRYGAGVGGVPPPQHYAHEESLRYGTGGGGVPPPYPPSSRPGYGRHNEDALLASETAGLSLAGRHEEGNRPKHDDGDNGSDNEERSSRRHHQTHHEKHHEHHHGSHHDHGRR